MMWQGDLLLQVKWQGYDDPADLTLEPEENLLYAAGCRFFQLQQN